mgnify:CR=1 FL=1
MVAGFHQEIQRPKEELITVNLADTPEQIAKAQEKSSFNSFSRDIENIFGLKSSSITSLMQGLEKKEFIKRVTGINDTRTKELVLTDKGKELVAISRKVFDDVEKAMVKEFSDEERNQFLNYLERVSRSLE